jgi:preprotein translocase subunit SecB
MKIKRSNLSIIDVNLLTSLITFIKGSKKEIDIFFKTNDIDIDFEILEHKENVRQFKIILILKVNEELNKPKPGYSIFIILEGVFIINETTDINEIESIKIRSALPMLISNLRSIVYDLTKNFPIGGFMLPSIEMNQLIDTKNKKNKHINK